ncbi:MAG TPA: hypothetical protein VLN74_14695, partial [Ilumatobacteraceae bacterium]|nr:hypothetical protein [Ilumatobacteraceae bacterium]
MRDDEIGSLSTRLDQRGVDCVRPKHERFGVRPAPAELDVTIDQPPKPNVARNIEVGDRVE